MRVRVLRAVEPWYGQLHEHIGAHYIPGQTVLVAGALNLAARLAHDRLGVPLATLLLQPAFLRSVHRSPVLPGLPTPDWAPRAWKAAVNQPPPPPTSTTVRPSSSQCPATCRTASSARPV